MRIVRAFSVILALLACSFWGWAQERQEREVPSGPALEQSFLPVQPRPEFEAYQAHLLETSAFLHDQAQALKAKYGTIYNSFGGVDPAAFALFDADTVISVGRESFGSIDQISEALTKPSSFSQLLSYYAESGYIRLETGYWSIGRPVGADFLMILKHIYGGRALSIKYLDDEKRGVEVTLEVGGRARTFYYVQTNASSRGDADSLGEYGLKAEVSPLLLDLLKKNRIDGVLSKASMRMPLAPEIVAALEESANPGALWMGENAQWLGSKFFVQKMLAAKLQGRWSYEPGAATVPLIQFRQATAHERAAATPPRKSRARRFWDWISSYNEPVVLNPHPLAGEVTQPVTSICQRFLDYRKPKLEAYEKSKPRPGGSLMQVRM